MITLKIDGKEFYFDKNEMEKKLSEAGMEKLKESDFDGKKSMFGSLIGSALMMMGIKKPKEAKDMDNMEFASRLALHMILNNLEDKTIELESSGKQNEENQNS
jgi:hypothetical protein